ncbi:MAG: glutathione peroxidase [Lachnospiraceae bacterium]|nr:glutathione peroxidase [Lachnospiraceae bacterium]
MSIFDFKVIDAEGQEVSLREYEGKVILINNSATECGFTPQYDLLQDTYEMYENQNFVILDFPCNQFGNQAPGSTDEIVSFCDSTFGITFPIFEKIDVNGPNEIPLYSYLKAQKGFSGFDEEHELAATLKDILSGIDPDYEKSNDIKWNFTKFLIDKKGNVVERYEPTADIMLIRDRIEMLLRE